MDQHPVDVAADAIDDLAVPRRIVAHDDDVAHRAEYRQASPASATGRRERPRSADQARSERRGARTGIPRGPPHRAAPPRRLASNASRRRSRSRSSIGAPRSSINAKLASRARSGGSWTSVTAGSRVRLCGIPPETTVTAIPRSTSASAMRSVALQMPDPQQMLHPEQHRALRRSSSPLSSRGPPRPESGENRAQPRRGHGQIVLAPDPRARRRTHRRAPVRIEDQMAQRGGERVSGSPGGTSSPVSRSATIPPTPPLAPATTGSPLACASSRRHAERLVDRRPDEQIGIGESGGDGALVERAAPADSGAERGERRRDLASRFAVPDHVERPVEIGQHRERVGKEAIRGELVTAPHHRHGDQADRRFRRMEPRRGGILPCVEERRKGDPAARIAQQRSRRNRDRRG